MINIIVGVITKIHYIFLLYCRCHWSR